jgi:hypothetical protein
VAACGLHPRSSHVWKSWLDSFLIFQIPQKCWSRVFCTIPVSSLCGDIIILNPFGNMRSVHVFKAQNELCLSCTWRGKLELGNFPSYCGWSKKPWIGRHVRIKCRAGRSHGAWGTVSAWKIEADMEVVNKIICMNSSWSILLRNLKEEATWGKEAVGGRVI